MTPGRKTSFLFAISFLFSVLNLVTVCLWTPSSCPDLSGTYLYFETSFAPEEAQAKLESPLLPGGDRFCEFNFHYHMYGSHVGSLAVELVPLDSSDVSVLWKSELDRGDRWFFKEIFVNQSKPYRLRLVATRGYGYRGDISVDNLGFGPCQTGSGKMTVKKKKLV